MIAALFVETGGIYFGLEGVDPWDVHRDATGYAGDDPVVAHPPCNVWCQLASVNAARWGSSVGDDGGLFAFALETVRRCGGVLEHPAYSLAWDRYGLPRPMRNGWSSSMLDPGITTEVSQAAYGCAARKRTWLYAVGVDPVGLDWRDVRGTAVVGAGVNSGECAGRGRLEKNGPSSRTPVAFRDTLLSLAASVH